MLSNLLAGTHTHTSGSYLRCGHHFDDNHNYCNDDDDIKGQEISPTWPTSSFCSPASGRDLRGAESCRAQVL